MDTTDSMVNCGWITIIEQVSLLAAKTVKTTII